MSSALFFAMILLIIKNHYQMYGTCACKSKLCDDCDEKGLNDGKAFEEHLVPRQLRFCLRRGHSFPHHKLHPHPPPPARVKGGGGQKSVCSSDHDQDGDDDDRLDPSSAGRWCWLTHISLRATAEN